MPDTGRPETAEELVVDLDVPPDANAEAVESLARETNRIVFNILFVSFEAALVIVVLSLR